MKLLRTVCIIFLCLALCACGRRTAGSDISASSGSPEGVTFPQSETQTERQTDIITPAQNGGFSETQTDTPVRTTESESGLRTGAAVSARTDVSSGSRRDPAISTPAQTTKAQTERQTTRSAAAESQTKLRQTVNTSYGQTQRYEEIGSFADTSDDFRTEDSYAYEANALRAAQSMFAETLASPESLSVSETRITDCADDGDNVYYRIFMRVAYRVQTGEEIRRGVFHSIGVRKKDGSAFDASAQIHGVIDAYSIYAPQVRKTQVECDPASPDYALAAQKIALSQLKKPASGVFQSCTPHADTPDSDAERVVYDVVCKGENDYGMQIPGVYTVYMVMQDGMIRQIDPSDD